nr:DUF916 domain-containing protein [Nesterenkonia sp. Act20]
MRWSLAPLLLALSLILVPTQATASTEETEESVNLSLQPVDHPGSYFALTMEPGESQELTFAQANNGEAELDVIVYPADAYTLVNGGFGARESGSETTGTTTWLDYGSEELTLQAGQTRESSITLTVPPETPPGQYITSLVLQNAEPLEGSGDVALNQTVRQAMPITIEVPGELDPAFELGGASHKHAASRSVIEVELTNTGTAHLEPAGDFTIKDEGGETVSEASVALGDVIAGTQTTVEVTLDGALEPGEYTASGSMTDADSEISAALEGQRFTVEEAAVPPSDNTNAEQSDLPGISQAPLPSVLIYILGATVLILLGLVIYLILRSRKASRSS